MVSATYISVQPGQRSYVVHISVMPPTNLLISVANFSSPISTPNTEFRPIPNQKGNDICATLSSDELIYIQHKI